MLYGVVLPFLVEDLKNSGISGVAFFVIDTICLRSLKDSKYLHPDTLTFKYFLAIKVIKNMLNFESYGLFTGSR